MPLGLAKDSMLNLAELASKVEEDSAGLMAEDDTKEQEEEDNNSLGEYEVSERHRSTDAITGLGNDETLSVTVTIETSKDIVSNNKADKKPQDTEAQTNLYQYAGFRADYHDFESYTSYSFDGTGYNISGSTSPVGRATQDEGPCWRCIFPWLSPGTDDDTPNRNLIDDTFVTDENIGEGAAPLSDEIIDKENDANTVSIESDIMARDNIPQSDGQPVSTTSSNLESERGSFSSRRKGILRHPRARQQQSSLNQATGSKMSTNHQAKRRSLFPAYEPKSNGTKNLTTSFSPMARVVSIKSSKDMDDEEKASIWWQKPDYDEFRKTGRMISKVMLQGGSEIWLATNQSWQVPNQGKAATLRFAMANVDNEDASEKWWHKFGHSRRGLEHIASLDEGRQRQSNVKTSIRAVLTEQRRQKAFHREDPEKLRICSIQNTSWAKDLALASGASDADAVTKNFDDESRKSREFYLLKFSRAGKLNSTTTGHSGSKQVVPAFMQPMLSMSLQPNRLDANTTSRLKFRKKQNRLIVNEHKRMNGQTPSLSESTTVGMEAMSSVPIHDPPVDESGKRSLASQAAGFANGEETVNMSAVLTGMGAIPKNPDATHVRPVLA